jgi:hypothetical protein
MLEWLELGRYGEGRVEQGGGEHTDVLRTGVDGGPARNVYDAVFLLKVYRQGETEGHQLLDWACRRGRRRSTGPNGTFLCCLCRDRIVSPVARQFSSHQLVILDQGKRPKERITYGVSFARGFVRWSEQGNALIQMARRLSAKRLLLPLSSHSRLTRSNSASMSRWNPARCANMTVLTKGQFATLTQ